MRKTKVWPYVLLLWLVAPAAAGATTRIAVAANFHVVMQEIVARFQQQSGHRVLLSSGSSGTLFAQILNGAPFDGFLSADADKPDRLVELGLARDGQRFTYAIGALALWGIDSSDPLADLNTGNYRRLAIANPRHAPYGIAAMQVLTSLDRLASAEARLVKGENIAQAYQFVTSGNADLGLVALSQIMVAGRPHANAWRVPVALHQPIRQDAVLLKAGESNRAALDMMTFLRGETAAGIMEKHGYDTVNGNSSASRS